MVAPPLFFHVLPRTTTLFLLLDLTSWSPEVHVAHRCPNYTIHTAKFTSFGLCSAYEVCGSHPVDFHQQFSMSVMACVC